MAYGPVPKDYSGQTFHGVTVLNFSHAAKLKRYFVCRCHCGQEFTVNIHSLRHGHVRSCGCLSQAWAASGQAHRSHGRAKSAEWHAWVRMIQRCYNPRNPKYPSYGGRGITVCPQWRTSFANFFADLGLKPSPQHTLGRIDNDGHYEPSNCAWQTAKEQANNRRKAPPRPSHPNSLKNLTRMTPQMANRIWRTTRKHERAKPKQCDYCGQDFYGDRHRGYAHVFCSIPCRSLYRKLENKVKIIKTTLLSRTGSHRH